MSSSCGARGNGVLQRHGGRVRVRERLVRLGDEEGEEGDDRSEPSCDDGRRKRGRIAEVTREDEHGTEREEPGVGYQVAEPRACQRAAPGLREPRVVGGVRHPRDRDPDHDVSALPDGEPSLALRVPDRAEVGAVERPPGEVEERERNGPDREPTDEPTDEADGPEQSEHESAGAEDESPEPLRAEPEELVRERSRSCRDHEQLEDRPADSLQHVDPRRQERAALAQGRAHERHPGDARVCADHPRDREHRVPDDAADDDRDEGIGKRERRYENRAGHDDQERDAEVAPEEARLEPAEDAKARRDGIDSPAALDHLLIRHRVA